MSCKHIHPCTTGDAYEDLVASDIRCHAVRSSHSWQPEHGHDEEEQLDRAASGSEEEDPAQSHVGLWPHFALLNHSCLPSCVHYVIDSTMVRELRSKQTRMLSAMLTPELPPVASESTLPFFSHLQSSDDMNCQLYICLPALQRKSATMYWKDSAEPAEDHTLSNV